MGKKFIRDNVHGDIDISDLYVKKILNSQIFQRLRYISQTGFAYLVYPCLRHTRFEHSLGSYYIAQELLDNLRIRMKDKESCLYKKISQHEDLKNKNNNLKIKDSYKLLFKALNKKNYIRWSKIFKLAALMHDIGHGPFSHTFEKLELLDHMWIKNKFKEDDVISGFFIELKTIKHEDMSIAFIYEILNEDKEFKKSDIKYIAALINEDFRNYFWKIKNKKTEDDIKITILFSPLISGIIDIVRIPLKAANYFS